VVRFLPALALLLVTVLAYLPALEAGYIWDDDDYVTDNPTLRSLSGLRDIWFVPRSIPQWYPLVHTTFWIEFRLWGLEPLGYHLTNVLLHAVVGVLLWRLLRRLELPGAWLAAAIFLVHPVHVESVAWITERKNVLSGVFYVASALLLIRVFALDRDRPPEPKERNRLLVAAFLLFVLALLSKTVTASLPAAVALLIWWKRERITRVESLRLAPMFVVGAGFGLYTAWLERDHVGAVGPAWDLSFLERTLIASRAVWFYLYKLIIPYPLMFTYPRWEIDTGSLWQYLFPLGAAVLLLALWRLRGRFGRGPLVAALFFGGTLLPALGFLNTYPMQYSFVADHFQYLASLGPIVLFTAGAARLATRFDPRRAWPTRVLASGTLALFGILTWRQAQAYEDAETLWRHTLERNPSSWMGHNNLGAELSLQGRSDEALASFRASLSLNPDNPNAVLNMARELLRRGEIESSVPWFRRAVELEPQSAEYRYELASALAALGRWADAEASFRNAVALEPGSMEALHGLAVTLAALGDLEGAVVRYQEALELAPRSPEIHNDLAIALWELDRRTESVVHFREAVNAAPGQVAARLNLAGSLTETGQVAEAVTHLRVALQLDPGLATARLDLAWVLATAPDPAIRDGAEAESLARTAITALGPDDPDALDVLAAALAEAGRFDEAVTQAERARDLARAAGRLDFAAEIEGRVASYLAGEPWRADPD
jgi:protein O-mannosyl-transferase